MSYPDHSPEKSVAEAREHKRVINLHRDYGTDETTPYQVNITASEQAFLDWYKSQPGGTDLHTEIEDAVARTIGEVLQELADENHHFHHTLEAMHLYEEDEQKA